MITRSILRIVVLATMLAGCVDAPSGAPDAVLQEHEDPQAKESNAILVNAAPVAAWVAVGVAGSGIGSPDPTAPPTDRVVRFTVPQDAVDLTASATWTCTAGAPACTLHWTLHAVDNQEGSRDGTDSIEFHVARPVPGEWRMVLQYALQAPASVSYGVEGNVTVVARVAS